MQGPPESLTLLLRPVSCCKMLRHVATCCSMLQPCGTRENASAMIPCHHIAVQSLHRPRADARTARSAPVGMGRLRRPTDGEGDRWLCLFLVEHEDLLKWSHDVAHGQLTQLQRALHRSAATASAAPVAESGSAAHAAAAQPMRSGARRRRLC